MPPIRLLFNYAILLLYRPASACLLFLLSLIRKRQIHRMNLDFNLLTRDLWQIVLGVHRPPLATPPATNSTIAYLLHFILVHLLMVFCKLVFGYNSLSRRPAPPRTHTIPLHLAPSSCMRPSIILLPLTVRYGIHVLGTQKNPTPDQKRKKNGNATSRGYTIINKSGSQEAGCRIYTLHRCSFAKMVRDESFVVCAAATTTTIVSTTICCCQNKLTLYLVLCVPSRRLTTTHKYCNIGPAVGSGGAFPFFSVRLASS